MLFENGDVVAGGGEGASGGQPGGAGADDDYVMHGRHRS
jgi:hypothetical protein